LKTGRATGPRSLPLLRGPHTEICDHTQDLIGVTKVLQDDIGSRRSQLLD
jgi:hypothetical protein